MLMTDHRGPLGLALQHPAGDTSRGIAHPPTIRGAALPYEAQPENFDAPETINQLVALSRPVGELVLWGVQLSNQHWGDVTPRFVRLVQVTDQILAEVQRRTFGWEIENAGVLMRTPKTLSSIEETFVGSPYQVFGSYGVSTPRDNRSRPPMYFLVLAARREQTDPEQGRESLGQLARRLGGIPVVAISERPTLWECTRPFNTLLQEYTLEGRFR